MKKKQSVTHRTKHDSEPRRKAAKLAEHPAMKELSRMVEAGEISAGRTLGYLKGSGTQAAPKRGGGGRDR